MSYAAPRIVVRPTLLRNYFARTFAPKVLQVVHCTGNLTVIRSYTDGIDEGETAWREHRYASSNPAAADGPSAHDYVARNGQALQMLDPARQVAWSNGDLSRPNTKLAGVRYLVDLRARGVNANRGCYREIELVADPRGYDPTDAQLETCAYWLAVDSIETGLPIRRGETVLTHADINAIDRANCAFRPAIRETRLAWLCRRGIEIKALLEGAPAPAAEPDKEETVKAFPVYEQPMLAKVKTGAWLYDNSALQPSAGNVQLDPGRELAYVGTFSSAVRIVAYEGAEPDVNASSLGMFVRATDIEGTRRAPAATPSPADLEAIRVEAARAEYDRISTGARITLPPRP